MAEHRFKAGLWVALVTPLKGGLVDHDRLRALVEWHVDQGTDGLVPCGTTGESATLSHDEHRAVVETVIDAAAGRVQIMAGTGSNSTREAINLTQHAKDAGAFGGLVITPYYNKPTQEGLFRHFAAIAEAVPDFPICAYNVPGRTSIDMLPATVARIQAAVPTVTALKEASGSIERISDLRCVVPGIDLYSGDDSMTLPMLSLGARGVISVLGNVAPKRMLKLLAHWHKGELQEALTEHLSLYEIMNLMFLETNPIPVKAAVALQGRIDEEFRMPLVEPTEECRAKVRAALEALGLL